MELAKSGVFVALMSRIPLNFIRATLLNKLDSGEEGDFTVEFDYKVGNGWVSGTHGPFTFECNDDITIGFAVMH